MPVFVTRHKVWITLGLTVAIGVLLGGLGHEVQSAANPTAIPTPAGAAWKGAGILHARVIDADGRIQFEEWLNRRTGATRSIEYDADGRPVAQQVQRGLTLVTWNTMEPERKYVLEALDARDRWLRGSSQVLWIGKLVDASEAHVTGTAQTNRGPVFLVEPDSPGADAPPGFELTVEVDQETFLPYRFISSSAEGLSVTKFLYRRMDAKRVSRSLFAVDASTWVMRDRRIAYADLAVEVPFPVFALGRTYEHLRFAASDFQEHAPELTNRIAKAPELFLIYAEREAEGEAQLAPLVTLMEQAADSSDAQVRLRAYQRSGITSTLPIAGAQRTVYFLDRRQPTAFAVVVGRTVIRGQTMMSREEAARMLTDLRVLD
jgi:hypothetical protein